MENAVQAFTGTEGMDAFGVPPESRLNEESARKGQRPRCARVGRALFV